MCPIHVCTSDGCVTIQMLNFLLITWLGTYLCRVHLACCLRISNHKMDTNCDKSKFTTYCLQDNYYWLCSVIQWEGGVRAKQLQLSILIPNVFPICIFYISWIELWAVDSEAKWLQSSQNAKEIIEYRKKSPNGATHNYMESHSALFISNVPWFLWFSCKEGASTLWDGTNITEKFQVRVVKCTKSYPISINKQSYSRTMSCIER